VNEQQRQAAQLLGQGLGTEAIARIVGVSPKTITRWKKLPDFKQTVARKADPTIRTALEDALHANKRDGSPDHPVRIAAAKALMTLGEATPADQPQTVLTIYRERPAA
jgi:ribonuclease D